MARPARNNCDYFPHDRDMRDHRKVKAIRSKFGIIGYGIWVMILEHLTGSDGNVFEYSDLEFELMAGSFGVSATEIRDVVDYCIKLELLFNAGGWVNSYSLNERLAPVYEKRGRSRDLSNKQKRTNGKFVTNNTDETVVSVTEMPQSKVKEIEVKEIEVNESETIVKNFDWYLKQFDEIYVENIKMIHKGKDFMQAAKESFAHLGADSLRLHNAESSDCKKLLNTWLSNQKQGKHGKQPTATTKDEWHDIASRYLAAKDAGAI